jgi:glucokinase
MTLPPLQNWSDVTFLQWNHITARNPGALKYVWRVNIFNADTYAIVKEALKRKYNEEPSTLGRAFSMDDEEGKAVLGTVHGAGVAYLLAQHKKQMGLKTVRGVYVFQSPEKDNERRVLVRGLGPVLGLQLVFIIEDVGASGEQLDFRRAFEAAVG